MRPRSASIMCWEFKKRVALVGDASCGKTALAARLTQDVFLHEYAPTEFDDFVAEVNTKLGVCQLTVLDTGGEHRDAGAAAVRSKAYTGCDAVIVCFDLTDQSTLESVEAKWVPEVIKHCPGVPVYIAGCKRDAMCDAAAEGRMCSCGAKCCTQTEGDLLELIEKTEAVAYTECSALTFENVQELFHTVAEVSSCKRKNSTGKKIMRSLRKRSRRLQRRLSAHFS